MTNKAGFRGKIFWHVFLDVKMIALRRHTVFFFFFFRLLLLHVFADGGISETSERVARGRKKKTAGMISLFGDRQVEMCIISFSAA